MNLADFNMPLTYLKRAMEVMDDPEFGGLPDPLDKIVTILRETYEPLIDNLDNYLKDWVIAGEKYLGEIPAKEDLNQQNFGELTIYKRAQIWNVANGWIDYPSDSDWLMRQTIAQFIRNYNPQLIEYVLHTFPEAYEFTYRVL